MDKESAAKGSPGKNIDQLCSHHGQTVDGKSFVDKIVSVSGKGDKKKVLILWTDGSKSYEQFSYFIKNYPEVVGERDVPLFSNLDTLTNEHVPVKEAEEKEKKRERRLLMILA